jgi:hypothetical protein
MKPPRRIPPIRPERKQIEALLKFLKLVLGIERTSGNKGARNIYCCSYLNVLFKEVFLNKIAVFL